MTPHVVVKCVAAFLLVLAMGCAPTVHRSPDEPIPTLRIAAPNPPAKRLVIVLPGRQDDLRDLRGNGIVDAIQGAWPDADVVLAELTIDYYMARTAIDRLHAEIVQPNRANYRDVRVVGASLGAMGALRYEMAHPGVLDGLVLLGPYLGEGDVVDPIRAAGGVAQWNPPAPSPDDDAMLDLWAWWKAASREPRLQQRVFVIAGEDDRFAAAQALLRESLPRERSVVLPGGHRWTVWIDGFRRSVDRMP